VIGKNRVDDADRGCAEGEEENRRQMRHSARS
jgi:hypothetical protein